MMKKVTKINNLRRRFIILRLSLMNSEKRATYLKKKSIFMEFGENVKWSSRKLPTEPYLVKIHNNVRIASNVDFCTHDVISGMFERSNSIKERYGNDVKFSFSMGTIEVFDNVMIGTGTILLYNIKIGPNAIIGAGSVVTKDVPPGTIVAGNPARVIGNFFELAEKRHNSSPIASNHDCMDKIIRDYWQNRV